MDTVIDLRSRFDAEGYVKLDGVFTHDEMSELRDAIYASRDHGEAGSHLDKGGLRFYENLFRRSPYVRDFVTQERVVRMLSSIIGPDFWIRWDQCVRKLPGGAAFPWHQDNAYTHIREEYFQLWVAISAGTKDNGGLWLQPSGRRERLSHEQSESHLVCSTTVSPELFVAAEPGDVVVFSSLVPHRTGANNTAADRWAYVAEFMSVDQYDPLIRPPYFMVAKGGQPTGEFVETLPARTRNLKSRMRYLPLQAKVALTEALRRSRRP